MPFIIRIPGHEPVEDLDFTLDDMDLIERESGVFWVMASPFKSAKVAKAYLKVAYRHLGLDPKAIDKLTQRDMRGWFDYEEDKEVPSVEAVPTKGRKAPTRRSSSSSVPTTTSGPQLLPENKLSATS